MASSAVYFIKLQPLRYSPVPNCKTGVMAGGGASSKIE